MKYPIAKPYITEKEKQYVLEVLNSNWLSLGPKVKKFEKKFTEKLGVKYACAVNSGTSGLHLAMLASDIGKGDEVITSPFSFIASANSILFVGAKPIFCDIEPETYNIEPKKIEEKINHNTKAILVVHILGQPCNMDAIIKIAEKHNLKIIEDACESIMAEYKGKKAGTFGESSVFAFYPNKQMTTGEGGMIATNNKEIHELCCSLRNQGRAPNMQWLDHKYLGYNYRMPEISAVLGIAQLEKIDWMIEQRRKIAEMYNKELEKYKNIIEHPKTAETNTHTWFVYVTLLKNKTIRDRVIKDLKEQGIATKPYFPSIHLFSFYKQKFGYQNGDFPVSENISDRAIALPFYIGLTEQDIKCIVEALSDVIKKYAK